MRKPFYNLTMTGRTRRMHVLARAALQHYPIEIKSIRQMSDDWNYIFRVVATDGSKYVLRVAYPDCYSVQETRSEMTFLNWLATETELTVTRPVSGKDGELVYIVKVDGVPEARNCVLFEWITGSDLGDQPSVENFETLGRLSATLHTQSYNFPAPDDFDIMVADTLYNPKDEAFLFRPEHAHLMTAEQRATLERAATMVEAATKALWTQPGKCVIHGDLHGWNVMLAKDGTPMLIDFEDIAWGYPLQDIAVTFYYLFVEDDEEGYDYATDTEAFKRGYESVTEWPVPDQDTLNTFIIRRALDLCNFVVGSEDPEMKEFAPKMVERTVTRIEKIWA